VFFTANDGTTGTELYVSDSTKAGTKLVKDIWPGSSSGFPFDLVPVGNRYCYFRAQVPTKEHELWRSDGTAAGTVEVLDIWPGAPGGNPSWMMVMGDSLFVHGIDPLKGSELMKIPLDALADHVGDGCAGGTNHPRLHITDPVLNKQITIPATGAPAGARGVMFSGPVASPEQLLGGNCTLYVDLNNLLILMFFNPVGGSYKLTLNVPNDNNLIGLCIPLQVAYGPTSTVPFGLDLTNGVFLSPDVK
jgi:ELWxxDGT repeat protein